MDLQIARNVLPIQTRPQLQTLTTHFAFVLPVGLVRQVAHAHCAYRDHILYLDKAAWDAQRECLDQPQDYVRHHALHLVQSTIIVRSKQALQLHALLMRALSLCPAPLSTNAYAMLVMLDVMVVAA